MGGGAAGSLLPGDCEGGIEIGVAIHLEIYAGVRVSLLEIYRAEFIPPRDTPTFHRNLAEPLAMRIRQPKEIRVASLLATGTG